MYTAIKCVNKLPPWGVVYRGSSPGAPATGRLSLSSISTYFSVHWFWVIGVAFFVRLWWLCDFDNHGFPPALCLLATCHGMNQRLRDTPRRLE